MGGGESGVGLEVAIHSDSNDQLSRPVAAPCQHVSVLPPGAGLLNRYLVLLAGSWPALIGRAHLMHWRWGVEVGWGG